MNSRSSGFGPVPIPIVRSVLLLGVLAASGATAQQLHDDHHHDHDHDDTFDQHGVHEHGKVNFNVALEGQQLVVELDAPASNVIGFEHAPRTDAEKAKVREMDAWLRAGKNLIGFPVAAACVFKSTELTNPVWKDAAGHADYEVRLTYQCEQSQRLEWLQLSLLGGLHEVREARVNVLTPTRQGSETVKAADTRVKLR